MKKVFIPLAFFFCLIIFLAIGLNRDPREIPSPLIGKPAPAFNLVTLESDKTFSPEQMLGKVWMFNVWATWCVACREEHPVLVAFAEKNQRNKNFFHARYLRSKAASKPPSTISKIPPHNQGTKGL